jgi:hypothetical protein
MTDADAHMHKYRAQRVPRFLLSPLLPPHSCTLHQNGLLPLYHLRLPGRLVVCGRYRPGEPSEYGSGHVKVRRVAIIPRSFTYRDGSWTTGVLPPLEDMWSINDFQIAAKNVMSLSNYGALPRSTRTEPF